MIYLIPTFNCVIFDGKINKLKANVKYELIEMGENCGLVYSSDNASGFFLDLYNPNKNVLKLKNKHTYYFLFKENQNDIISTSFKFKSNEVYVSLSSCLFITINGMLICEENVENLKFSHYEIDKDLCVVYFEGIRNYVVILKDDKMKIATYYDEVNESENEKYFMMKYYDSLNHGRVVKIKNSEVEEYLVYLDEEDLQLKEEFISFVFLDCVKAKNFKYANELLCENLKLKDEKEIEKFFTKFDYFYPIEKNIFALIKKNTLAGIYEFSVENCLISNIIHLT